MRILMLYPFLVKAGSLGGVARISRLVKYLDARGHDVWLACFAYPGDATSAPAVEEIGRHCREMTIVPVQPPSAVRRAAALLFGRDPSYVVWYRSAAMRNELRRVLFAEDIDVFHIEFTYLGDYVSEAEGTACSTVLVDEELNFHATRRLFQTAPLSLRGLRALWESGKFKRHELGVASRFDKVLAIVDGERELLLKHLPKLDVDVYPNTIDTGFFAPLATESQPHTIAFVGNFEHYPNEDGVRWFASEVMPLVLDSAPGARLEIIGANATAAVQALDDGRSVIVRGFVDDIRPYLAGASVFVCPIINGGGMRGKALEAMSMQLPVVATPIGIEGIGAEDGRHVLVAGDPASFAQAILRLFEDADLRHKIGETARDLVKERYDDRVVFAELERTYEGLAAKARTRRPASAGSPAVAALSETSRT